MSNIRYLNPEQLGLTREDRKSVFDVCCKTDSGEEFIVEMQKERQTYFRDRALYYSTYPLREQGRKGDWSYRLTPVYMVGILDFTLDHPTGNGTGEKGMEEKLIYRYSLRESETGEEMTENDRKNALDYARQEGRQEGIAKGHQAGLAEGEKKGRQAAAAGMTVTRPRPPAGVVSRIIAGFCHLFVVLLLPFVEKCLYL